MLGGPFFFLYTLYLMGGKGLSTALRNVVCDISQGLEI